jgi:hypothetical protein
MDSTDRLELVHRVEVDARAAIVKQGLAQLANNLDAEFANARPVAVVTLQALADPAR